MTPVTTNAWHARADDLARWAALRIVNRTDRCGGCWVDTRGVHPTTRPVKGPSPGFVNHKLLARHFRTRDTADVIGLHALGTDGAGKWVGVDIDAHPGAPTDPAANERFARTLYDDLRALGFAPLLNESNGTGGYHLRALFADPVEGPVLFAFGRWLVRRAGEFGFTRPPEVFPKQPALGGSTKFGNWLRLIGRHHARDFWPRVWSGADWLEGASAVEHVLGLSGESASLIPDAALTYNPNPPVPRSPVPTQIPAEDVFASFNRSQTMEAMAALLRAHRWEPAGRRGPRWDFRRPGKNGDKSGNLMLVSGVPIFYGFTDAAGIPDHRGLNPSQLRAALEHSNNFAALADRLRTEGYGPPRRAPIPRPTEARSTRASNATKAPDAPEAHPSQDPVHEDFLDPHRLGRLLVPRLGDLPTLVYHRAEWWEWKSGRYVTVTDDDFSKRAWTLLREECEADHRVAVANWEADGRRNARPKVVKLDGRKVGNAVHAAAAMCHLDGDTTWPLMLAPDAPQPGRIPRLHPVAPQREYIACANGLIDVAELLARGTTTVLPATPLFFTPAALPVKFEPGTQCPKFEAFLGRITDGDTERAAVLQEMAGYLLRYDSHFQTFFVLSGDGSNGKSTFLAALRALVGDWNYSSVPLEEFGERFALSSTLGKLVNAVAEVGEMDRVAEAKLKSFVSGDLMSFDRKNKTPLHTRPTARLLLLTNTLPRFADRTEGVWRRYQLVPFTAVISDSERVRGMSEPEWWAASGELPGILNWALAGLCRLYRQGHFTASRTCEAAKTEHRELCNPHRQFLDEHVKAAPHAQLRTTELFAAYVEWCRQRRYLPLSDGNFGGELRKAFREVRKARPREGRERQHVYVGVTWAEGRPDALLIDYDRRRRDAPGWSPGGSDEE
ncbi:Predicted ATPase OS=uncultured Gemmatimonadales bacterium HF0770_11C06 PE=4 SV=1 [Gemmata massiliana]|uniref:SF3 helicase domain-containing protein n=1 Tax=Gemmata massiliana TaxID=1210884 RepID=A0A6P2CYT4_9BACT|nr:Predicted ATPase OS=uncultured Gemmatimonadales bacterium HF0770_11C06 PE=4 SV=1 [Gemmata massiliana]